MWAEVIGGWERRVVSSRLLTCNPFGTLLLAMIVMYEVATAVITIPPPTDRATPIEPGGGCPGVHPLFPCASALGSSGVCVTGSFHNSCASQTKNTPPSTKRI